MGKILIFTVHAGGGHMAACQALKDYIGNDHEIIISSIFKEIISNVDPIYWITFGIYTLDDWYNSFLAKKYNRIINIIAFLGALVYPIYQPFIKKLIFRYVKKVKPDLIISVVPIINNAIGSACQKCNIPFILVPTDLDTSWFTKRLNTLNYKNFIFALSFDDSMLWQKLKGKKIAEDQIEVTGFPIKKSFFEPKNILAIKKEFNVPENKPVLMMLMGGVGSDVMLNYLCEITKIDFPLHIIVCLGKHEQLRKNIQKTNFPKNLTFSIIGFTDKIADLMTISDLLLSKSGSVSVCEALYMNLPLLLDATGVPLDWERFNLEFIKSHGFGDVITSYNQVQKIIAKYFSDKTYANKVKNNIIKLPKKKFGENIQQIVNSLLKK